MRTARKTQQEKQAAIAKRNGTPRLAASQILETLEVPAPIPAHSGFIAPRGMARVPTHTVPVPNERRAYPRARLRLPLKIVRIAGKREDENQAIYTTNISSSGLYAKCPFDLELGTPVDLEIELVRRLAGRGTVRMITHAHVVRLDAAEKRGWNLLAFAFDDISFQRDDVLPPRFAHS